MLPSCAAAKLQAPPSDDPPLLPPCSPAGAAAAAATMASAAPVVPGLQIDSFHGPGLGVKVPAAQPAGPAAAAAAPGKLPTGAIIRYRITGGEACGERRRREQQAQRCGRACCGGPMHGCYTRPAAPPDPRPHAAPLAPPLQMARPWRRSLLSCAATQAR